MLTEFGKTKAYVYEASQPQVVRLSITQYERITTCEPASPYNQGKSHGQQKMSAGEPLQPREVAQATWDERRRALTTKGSHTSYSRWERSLKV